MVQIASSWGPLLLINFYNHLGMIFPSDLFDEWNLSSSKIILCGDFNAHHEWWGSSSTCAIGIQVDAMIDWSDLVLLNDGTQT